LRQGVVRVAGVEASGDAGCMQNRIIDGVARQAGDGFHVGRILENGFHVGGALASLYLRAALVVSASRAVPVKFSPPIDSLTFGVFCTFCTHWRFTFAVPM